MKLFLNLLAATAGGQLSRSRAFLDRFETFAPQTFLVVAKDEAALTDYRDTANRTVLSVRTGSGPLKTLRRLQWENYEMLGGMRKNAVNAYLTFSHYLPMARLPVPSVVGVSNLAPFSEAALAHESLVTKTRLLLLRRTILSSARRATKVLALSETCRQVLIDAGIDSRKIAVTPNGVDDSWGKSTAPSDLLSKLGVTSPFLLYASHFYRYKNHLRLLEAYSRLPATLRAAHPLLLVGAPLDTTYYADVRSEIGRLALRESVIVLPGASAEHLRELYQRATLLVFPSLIENSPNILLEAMMAGTPILSSSFAPMREFCADAALYFDPLDVGDLREKLEALLNDASTRAALSWAARRQARKFSWDDFVVSVLRHLHAATGMRSAATDA